MPCRGVPGRWRPLFKRLVLLYREIVPVEYIEDTVAGIASLGFMRIGKKIVWKKNVGTCPVIVIDRVEKPAVQEGYFAFELAVVMIVMAAVHPESLIKKRLQNVVEKVVISAMLFIEQFAHELLRSGAPITVPVNAEPSFFLQEVKKDDLAEEFFGEVNRIHGFGVEIFLYLPVACYDFIEFRVLS